MVPGFSSTRGIQIAMTEFSDVKYNENDKTLEVGAGCLWDQVYPFVGKYDRNVVGGSAAQGVGVAGWLLGGGYSLPKTNQFGLGIDNVAGYRVILPSGEVKHAKPDDPNTADLFQALRGGGNNFGVVTHFILKTHEQVGKLEVSHLDFQSHINNHWWQRTHKQHGFRVVRRRYTGC